MNIERPARGWGLQTSLFQFRRPAFWAYVVIVLVAGLLTALEQSAFFLVAPVGLAVSWCLLALYLIPMAFTIYRLDLYEREPPSLVIAALLWGAVVATSFAGIANQGWGIVVLNLFGPDFAARWAAALTAPITEEILKGAGVVLIALIAREEVDDVVDGFVYGAMVGLGFAVVEDVYYFIAVFGGDIGGVVAGFFLRVIASGLYGHVLYSGLVGMGVAWWLTRRDAGIRRGIGAAGFVIMGMAGHFLWNSPLADLTPDNPQSLVDVFVRIPLALALKGVPLLIFVLLTVRLARRREVAWIGAVAADEVGGPALSQRELDVLASGRRRRHECKAVRKASGRRAAGFTRRLQREQVRLLMCLAREAEESELERQRAKCRELREQLAKR